jgi:hypothetical protein
MMLIADLLKRAGTAAFNICAALFVFGIDVGDWPARGVLKELHGEFNPIQPA